MQGTKLDGKDKKKRLLIGAVIVIIIGVAIALCCIRHFNANRTEETVVSGSPTLIVETPPKISISENDVFTIELLITELGKAYYPAASFSIGFDASRMEFMGVQEGNVFVRNDASDTEMRQKLPEWSCNTQQSNKSGIINIMYLDMTGGKNAFCQELLDEEDNVVLRLAFRLRGSARSGDIYSLVVKDAIFAASDETQSLSVMQDTLKIKEGKIVVGD